MVSSSPIAAPTSRATPTSSRPTQPSEIFPRKDPGDADGDVLIVEDDPDLRDALEELLADKGYGTLTAADGREALAILKRRRPSVIVLDLMMPNLSGYDVLDYLESDPRLSSIPVLITTAAKSLRMPNTGAVFVKPLNVASLLRAIKACVEGGAAGGPGPRR